MILDRYLSRLGVRRCTLLGVGPMSLNCIDASIEIANDFSIPLFLIASRRQIDSSDFGGGYVNNWTTTQFSDYVLSKDKKGMVLMARDHGGPWQNPIEVNQAFGLRKAMSSAKQSFTEDIECGFQAVHIDTSIDPYDDSLSIDEALYRCFELYEHCWSVSQKTGNQILFEIGTEEQNGSTSTQEQLTYTLDRINSFCTKSRIPFPSFVVIQCGTKVMEMSNVGSFESPVRITNELPAEIQLPKMLEICKSYNILMKEHNADYLSNEAILWHPRLGIPAANVAPEFGVAESKALLSLLRLYGLNHYADRFLQIAYDSRKWSKWLLPNSLSTTEEKAVMAGHYIFSNPSFLQLKEEMIADFRSNDVDLDLELKNSVKRSILRYAKGFGLVK